MKRITLLLLTAAAGCTALCACGSFQESSKSLGSYRTLTAAEAKACVDTGSATVLDVRSPAEYNEGHIPGAICIPNEDIDGAPASLPNKNAQIVVYCQSGRRSAEAASKLARLGYTNVSDLGGIANWPYETVR